MREARHRAESGAGLGDLCVQEKWSEEGSFPEEVTFALGPEGQVGVSQGDRERSRRFQEWPK